MRSSFQVMAQTPPSGAKNDSTLFCGISDLRYNRRMPKVEGHKPGAFCWVELGTTDQANAKSFYSSLFGWTPVDSPMGPNELYTMFKLNDGDAAAAYTMRPEERSMVPPHWNLYVAVVNADD